MIRIDSGHALARLEVCDLAHLHSARDQLGPGASMSVTTRRVPKRTGLGLGDPMPKVIEHDEPGSHLHDSKLSLICGPRPA